MSTFLSASTPFHPAVRLHRALPRRWQHRVRFALGFVTAGAAVVWVISYYTPGLPDHYATLSGGVALLGVALWIEQLLVYSFFNHYYFAHLRSLYLRAAQRTPTGVTFPVANIILQNQTDLTRAFIKSPIGQHILKRAGVPVDQHKTYLATERTPLAAAAQPLADTGLLTLRGFCQWLYAADDTFAGWLQEQGITEEEFFGAVEWSVHSQETHQRAERWWSRDNLSRIRGIGVTWHYGHTYYLDRYAQSLHERVTFFTPASDGPHPPRRVDDLASVLVKDTAANALIVGPDGVGKVDLVAQLERAVRSGTTVAAATGIRFVILNTNHLFSTHRERADLEHTLLQICHEAAAAGNVVLLIEHFSRLLTEGETLGVPVVALLEPFLKSPHLHIIATDTPREYHQVLEPRAGLVQHFSELTITPTDLSHSIALLQDLARRHEAAHQICFTYPAIVAIARGAERHIVTGVMPEKAVTLLGDIASHYHNTSRPITRADVERYLTDTLGVRIGPVRDGERDDLMQLETLLHQRIVGQDAAISAIADTIRRARAGIQDSHRPIGSFLFLGPTGVGKTETAKVLATTYFGAPESLHRLDMSEYSGEDALAQLIGTDTTSGRLADLLRDTPYGILLLDEFEKAHEAVHDLFLQILDEGVFTDGRNTTVSARNTIIIATSNAGAEKIRHLLTTTGAPAAHTAEVVEHLISNQHFKPELINRFDNTIIFHPLDHTQQSAVATLLLEELQTRLQDRGFTLRLAPAVRAYLSEQGFDQTFGARAMRRTMQETIEAAVAKKLIRSPHHRGDTIDITMADLADTTAE